MAKIGIPLPQPDLDSPLAEHFGKALWIAVVDGPSDCEFVRNTGGNGRSVVAELSARGCTDVVARRMGTQTYVHAVTAGLRVWEADDYLTARTAAEQLAAGKLPPLFPGAGAHDAGHGATRRAAGAGRRQRHLLN